MPWRAKLVLIGVGIGLLWGVALWVLGGIVNDAFEVRSLLLTLFAAGAIGGGVAAAFGAFSARERGEKIMPKSPYRKYKRKS